MSTLAAVAPRQNGSQSLEVARALTQTLGLHTAVVRSREAFDGLLGDWEALERRCSGATLFQGHGWARAIWDFEAARGKGDFDPVIVSLRRGGTLVGVLPLERVRTRTRVVLAPLGHAFGQYSDALLAEGIEPREAVGALLKAAIAAARPDAVSFLKVRSDSVLARGMPANHCVTGEDQGAPYVALDHFPNYASYFSTIKPKTRKNMRNGRNRLERDGALTHHVAQGPAETLGVIERTLEGRAERLRDQGLSSRAFRDRAFFDFCASLPARADLPLLAMSLHHNNRPIAEQWGFVHKGRYYAFVASRDFGNSDESPGKLHLGEVTQTCAALGLQGADLMVPVMPYKLTWATEVVSVRDYALPVTPRGLLMIRLWDRGLRPRLKAMMLAMPAGLRSALMKAAGSGL